jgi:hypothetical protein
MMTYNEFVQFYHKYGKCPNDLQPRSRPLNERELERRYEKYKRSEEKKKQTQARQAQKQRSSKKKEQTDLRWEETKRQVELLYGGWHCVLLSKIQGEQRIQLVQQAGPFLHIVDPAHVFPVGAYPHMRYVALNVVPLNRYSHSMLDSHRHPITGKPLKTAEDHRLWWIHIVGIDTFEYLEKISAKEG